VVNLFSSFASSKYYMRPILIILCLFLLNQLSFGQCDTNRYVNPIFNTVYKHSNVKYGEAPVWNIPYNNTDLFMDIYEPVGDVLTQRPLMLWVHPGGFLLGDKELDDMVALCDSFARRGYVTASIGYRLGFNPLSSSSAERAVYRGTQDVRAAIRYLMEYSDIYDIDTNYVFLGGSCAGAVATVLVVYADQDVAPLSSMGGFFVADLVCLDC
jgi:acetyl esterase/lipase